MDFPDLNWMDSMPAIVQNLGLEDTIHAAVLTQPSEDPAGQVFVHDNLNDLFAIETGVSANNENQENQPNIEDAIASEDEADSIGEDSDSDVSDDDWEVAAAFCCFLDSVVSPSSEDEDREVLAQQTECESAKPEVSDQNTIYQHDLDDAGEASGTNSLHGNPLSVQQAPAQALEFLSNWLNLETTSPQTGSNTGNSPNANQQTTHRNLQAHLGPTSDSVRQIKNSVRHPAFPVYQDDLDTPQQSSSYRQIAPVPPRLLQVQSTNSSLNSQLFDRPSPAQMAKMKSVAIPPPADRRANQQGWNDNEKDLLQSAAYQWWYWRDNGILPREAITGAALIRFFEHEFSTRGFTRSFHQLKNQWNRYGRAEFGRSEQRSGTGGSPKSLITSARPNAKREVEVLGGMRKRSRVESEEDENDKDEGFRGYKIAY